MISTTLINDFKQSISNLPKISIIPQIISYIFETLNIPYKSIQYLTNQYKNPQIQIETDPNEIYLNINYPHEKICYKFIKINIDIDIIADHLSFRISAIPTKHIYVNKIIGSHVCIGWDGLFEFSKKSDNEIKNCIQHLIEYIQFKYHK